MPEIAHILTEESCMPSERKPLNVNFLGPYKGHVCAISGPCLAIVGPCFDDFYNIFASRCLKWLIFSLESLHAKQRNTTFRTETNRPNIGGQL